jgi:TetR/AcrR family transcriptional regulator
MTDSARVSARTAVTDVKKGLLRDAAREVFARRGIRDASVREIAKTAGYATSAIYTRYRSVEELYGDIVRESLEALLDQIRAARMSAMDGARADASLRAVHRFYLDRPQDFELSFHLYDGVRPLGLGDRLIEGLNALMREVLAEIDLAFAADGTATDDRSATRAAVGLTFVFGLLLMRQTNRLAPLSQDPDRLLEQHLRLIGALARQHHAA